MYVTLVCAVNTAVTSSLFPLRDYYLRRLFSDQVKYDSLSVGENG